MAATSTMHYQPRTIIYNSSYKSTKCLELHFSTLCEMSSPMQHRFHICTSSVESIGHHPTVDHPTLGRMPAEVSWPERPARHP